MPKVQFVDPKQTRKSGKIKFRDILVNQYNTSFADEVARLGKDALIGIYRDMVIIREFETMLNEIKTAGNYLGVGYTHPGPAHLSIGQEASSVGQAYVLDVEDYIFGSHRSHGEILAKGLSAIKKLDEGKLQEIMRGYFDGLILRVVEKEKYADIKDLAERYLLYGTLAEIFA
ncbi:MAG: dehydrogenase, partial [Chitinivibrionales bacterium]|nr:dehydrogenase [Chitinivibrionales bacterium]